ncbi:MAG: hypothetical protein U0228_00390 [Myxococcaceae bacterium]
MDTADLEKKWKAAEARAAELQAWVDDTEAEAEKLRARVAELEAASPAAASAPSPRVAELEKALHSAKAQAAELQAWVDDSEAQTEKLNARIAELEAKPAPRGDLEKELHAAKAQAAELQAWVDDSEAETEKLRARVAELEAAGAGPASASSPRIAELEKALHTATARADELQAWADDSEAEAQKLRERLEHLEVPTPEGVPTFSPSRVPISSPSAFVADPAGRVAELEKALAAARSRAEEFKAWADDSEAEAERLRSRVVELESSGAAPASHPGGNEGAERFLRERVSELEALNHSLKEMAARFAEQLSTTAKRDVARMEEELEAARAVGGAERVSELESLLENAREAITTLETERAAAVEQVRRYVQSDSQAAIKKDQSAAAAHRADVQRLERQIATLEAQLAEKVDEASVLHVRLKAFGTEEARLQNELSLQRKRACDAEEKLGHAQTELAVAREDQTSLEARAAEVTRKLEESQRWVADGELETARLQKEIEVLRTKVALEQGSAGGATSAPAANDAPPPPPADHDDEGDGLEGFSVQRLHRLEALLAAEKLRADGLASLITTIEKSVATLSDELDVARGKLADLQKRLGMSDSETGEALDRLDAARRELHALKGELAKPRPGAEAGTAPGEPELDAADVVEAPLEELGALADQQAAAARQATEALAGEQRAREQLMGDLTWLKAELEKLTNVREELRHRVAAMVQRELRRRGVVAALLDKLRATEVTASARTASLRRLHAALDQAQRTAVKVQTVYFQKQIGSLQRQLEGRLRPVLKLAK